MHGNVIITYNELRRYGFTWKNMILLVTYSSSTQVGHTRPVSHEYVKEIKELTISDKNVDKYSHPLLKRETV